MVRQRRRNDLARMKRKAARLYPSHPKHVKYANYLTACSCPMCGNQRRFRNGEERLTMQERRIADECHE